MSNDNPSVTFKEKGLHYVAMSLMFFMIVMAAFVSYMAMQKQPRPPMEDRDMLVQEPVGRTKPLPDYMIEKIEKDELELLKP